MIVPDVNIMLYAFRPDLPEHTRHKALLDEVINGQDAYGMSPQALSTVIRITTQPKILTLPTGLASALDFASTVLHQPNCQIIEPGPRHWNIFTDLCRTPDAKGNLVQDAWFAALATESGCEWITNDRDYARFPGLKWRVPF